MSENVEEISSARTEGSQAFNSADYVGGASWLVSGVSVAALVGFSFLNHFAGQSRWIIPLFSLPLLGQTIGSVVLFHRPRGEKLLKTFHRFYLWIMILCIWSYLSFWLCYALWKFDKLPLDARTLSGLALFAIIVLVGLVVVMTLAIMCPPVGKDKHNHRFIKRQFSRLIRGIMSVLYNLKVGASQEPFLALLLFFTAFLAISYLFGFAFAFHDKSLFRPERALYMRNLYVPRAVSTPTDISRKLFRFQFDSLQAIPDIESNPAELQGAETTLKKVAVRKNNNYGNLEAAANYIKSVNPPNDALRVIVIGHADDAPTEGGAYLSNYELAQARAENVKHKIIERLAIEDGNRWRNVEWLCLSSSSEVEASKLEEIVKVGSGKKSKGRQATRVVGRDGERFVEVQIDRPWNQSTSIQMDHFQNDRPKELELIDYIYFANYTITTTGYGDIIPLTPYSKFVCSLANICEVFFLVVFFNALLSLKVGFEGGPDTNTAS